MFALTLIFSILGLGLLALNYDTPIGERWGFRGFSVLFALAFATVGALIAARQPRNWVGWIFCWSGLTGGAQFFLEEYTIYALLSAPGSLPFGIAIAWVQNWIWVLAATPLWAFLPLIFPHGRLPSPRWRPVAWLAAMSIFAAAVGFAFAPEPLDSLSLSNPLTFPGADLVALIAILMIGAIGLVAAISLLARLRRSSGVALPPLRHRPDHQTHHHLRRAHGPELWYIHAGSRRN
jgi:hypothetical protein